MALLLNGLRESGAYSLHWNGTDHTGRRLASGIYLCRLRSGNREEIRKLLLIE